MTWQQQVNSLFTDSFFRFLFGFTIIIAMSFGIIIVTDAVFGVDVDTPQAAQVVGDER
jgi:hypothetical protein